MASVAIITARGGSKRIPRKNIKDFLGKPIITYCIETALKSGLFDEVMVSTDDTEIAEIAQFYGAKIPFLRSLTTANDFATTAQVLKEVLENYQKEGRSFEKACCIYPTAPFISVDLLRLGYQKVTEEGFDSAFPVQRFGFPIQRALRMAGQKLSWISPENALTRSQDLETTYHDAGQFYFFDVAQFLVTNALLTQNSAGLEIAELAAQDIDNETDWKLAELKYKLMHENL
jgi:pseudaminic acid cytidylyltransferase